MKYIDLPGHITATYINLRVGIATIAILLPFILWFGGNILFSLPLQESMSAYYHASDGDRLFDEAMKVHYPPGDMRDVFVGLLITVGAFLYLYKGITNLENIALNLAGICLVGVALFPTEAGVSGFKLTLHGTFAILFFLAIAYVCIYRAADTLYLIKEKAKAKRYKLVYKWLGIGMIASPAIALVLTMTLQRGPEITSWLFVAEAVGVIVFALYWITKSREIILTNSERKAIEGKLRIRPLQAKDLFKKAEVVKIKTRKR